MTDNLSLGFCQECGRKVRYSEEMVVAREGYFHMGCAFRSEELSMGRA